MRADDKAPSLDEIELAFLEQLLWFTTNVIADSDRSHVDAFANEIHTLLGIVIHNFNKQFTEQLWKQLIWCLNSLSLGLAFLIQPNYEMFNSFVCLQFSTIEQLLFVNSSVEAVDRA